MTAYQISTSGLEKLKTIPEEYKQEVRAGRVDRLRWVDMLSVERSLALRWLLLEWGE